MISVVNSKLLYAALMRTSSALRSDTMSRVPTTVSLWMMRSTHSLSVPVGLQSEGFWKHIESFISWVMRMKDLDGRRECNNGEGH